MKSTILLSVAVTLAGLASAILAVDMPNDVTYAIDEPQGPTIVSSEGRQLYSKPQDSAANKHQAPPKPKQHKPAHKATTRPGANKAADCDDSKSPTTAPTSQPSTTQPPTTTTTETPTTQPPTTVAPTRGDSPCSATGPNHLSATFWVSYYTAPSGVSGSYVGCCEACWADSKCLGFASFFGQSCLLTSNIDQSNMVYSLYSGAGYFS